MSDDGKEFVPWPARLPTVQLEYGQLPPTAEFEQRVLATYHRTEVKPPYLSHGSPRVAWAAGVPYTGGAATPQPLTPAKLEWVIVNLITMSYISTEWGARCRRMAIGLVSELGIIWPNE